MRHEGTAEKLDRVEQMRAKGMLQREIAVTEGVSVYRIRQLLAMIRRIRAYPGHDPGKSMVELVGDKQWVEMTPEECAKQIESFRLYLEIRETEMQAKRKE